MDTNLSMNNNYKNSEFPATSVFWAITNFTPLLLLEAHAHWLWQIRYSLYTLFCLSSTVRLQLYCFLRTKQQTQNGVTHAKPHVMKPRLKLSHSFDSPRNRILKLGSQKSPGHREWGNLPERPCNLLKESDFAITNPLPANTTSFPCFLLLKVFHFVQPLKAPFYLLNGMLPNSWITE